MNNKLGISESRLNKIVDSIVNLKLNLLDETFTFNQNDFNIEYLACLHNFLFNDFYNDDEVSLRDLNKDEINYISDCLIKINYLCLNEPDKAEDILKLIENIWHLQPFIVGNTRTLIAFLKILSKSYMLNIDIDVNRNITNNPEIFKVNDIVVNQKGLTK